MAAGGGRGTGRAGDRVALGGPERPRAAGPGGRAGPRDRHAAQQGWYNTVRVIFCIVLIQYSNIMYCISKCSDKVVLVHRSYVPIVCSYSVLVYNVQLLAKIIFALLFFFLDTFCAIFVYPG